LFHPLVRSAYRQLIVSPLVGSFVLLLVRSAHCIIRSFILLIASLARSFCQLIVSPLVGSFVLPPIHSADRRRLVRSAHCIIRSFVLSVIGRSLVLLIAS